MDCYHMCKICVSHSGEVVNSTVLVCDTLWACRWIPVFQKVYLPSSFL
jgi:hypothetical protein